MDRRDFLRLGLTSSGALALALSGCARSGTPDGAVRVAQFGSASRMEIFRRLFAAYAQSRRPGTALAVEAASNTAYVDKLATQVSGGNAPDILGLQHLSLPDFARQNALAELGSFLGRGIDTSAFAPGTVELGMHEGRVLGLSYGDNAFGSLYDLDLVQAAEMSLLEPGHTWEQLLSYSADLGRASGEGVWGTEDRSAMFDGVFKVWLLQRGRYTFGPEGTLGFGRSDLADWMEFWQLMRDAGAAPPAEVTAEADGTFETSALIRGYTANHVTYANALASMQTLTDHRLSITTLPVAPGAVRTGHFVRGSNWVGVFALAESPDVAVDFLDFVLNDPVGVAILGAELGAPPNRELRATLDYPPPQQLFVDYIGLLSEGGFGDVPIPLTQEMPPAFNDISTAFTTAVEDVRFGRSNVSESTDWFFRTAERALEVLT